MPVILAEKNMTLRSLVRNFNIQHYLLQTGLWCVQYCLDKSVKKSWTSSLMVVLPEVICKYILIPWFLYTSVQQRNINQTLLEASVWNDAMKYVRHISYLYRWNRFHLILVKWNNPSIWECQSYFHIAITTELQILSFNSWMFLQHLDYCWKFFANFSYWSNVFFLI